MKIVKILAIIGFVLTLVINIFQYDKTVYGTDPYLSKLVKDAEIYSNHSTQTTSDKRVSLLVTNAKAGTSVHILENYFAWCKIQLPDGTMGWTDEKNLQIPDDALCRHTNNALCGLYDQPDARNGKQLLRLKKRTYLTILDHKTVTKARGYETGFTKVKAPDGTIGWIKDYHIERAGWKQPRRIKRKEWRYNKNSFINKWTGKDIEKFTKKFAEPSAIKNDNGKKIYYFNNIFLYDRNRVELGLKLTVVNNEIENINRSHRIKKWIGSFPLSSFLRSPLLNNNFWYFLSLAASQSYDKFGDKVKAKYQPNGWLRWVIVIVVGSALLSFFFMLVYLPYYLWDKATFRASEDKTKANNTILMIAVLGAIVLGYLWFVFLNVNFNAFNNYFLLHILFCLGMTTGFISKWNSDLMYNRCTRCRFWSGTHDYSELLGVTESTQTTTYSDGSKKREKGKTEHWRDHRYCNRQECGHKWYIDRNFWSGWKRA
ncbi:MAG: hypothetical protein DRH89_02515 [Candidatus Cloacimonadota bacterium]|nr:MAG: hypothetical protein DRH89_02515 [Candidatus Cloacimonadota bacterium]